MTKQEIAEASAWELTRIAKSNAPVRDATYTAKSGKTYKTYSKWGQPGNLKNKGITAKIGRFRAKVTIGGKNAPYAPITEYTSRKKGWIANSKQQFIQRLEALYGAKRR